MTLHTDPEPDFVVADDETGEERQEPQEVSVEEFLDELVEPVGHHTPPGLAKLLGLAMIFVIAVGALGFVIGSLRGGDEIVRQELVYTLDESVPDSFLREDRRLLTQVVTLESDAVLGPVGAEFDLSIDDLRDKIHVETIELSEVLLLEVRDQDRGTAVAISDAVIEQYLVVTSAPLPSETSDALRAERATVVDELADVDASLLAIDRARTEDARLATRAESLERQIELGTLQIDRLQGLLDDALVKPVSAARSTSIVNELTATQVELTGMEAALTDARTTRAGLAEQTVAELPLTREVTRLETDLTTIDQELARRELGPLVSSPVRVLSDPTFVSRSALLAGLQGLAIATLAGAAIAALAVVRARRRQLWLASC